MDTETTVENLGVLWQKLDSKLGSDELKTVVTKIISHHSPLQVFRFIEDQKQVSKEITVMKTQGLLCHSGSEVRDGLYQWFNSEEILANSNFVKFVRMIVDYGTIQEFKDREDIGYCTDDFAGVSTKAQTSLVIMRSLMDIFLVGTNCSNDHQQTEVYYQLMEALINESVIFVLQHIDESTLWTSFESNKTACHLLKDILVYKKKPSLAALLCEDCETQSGYFTILAKRLLPQLTKANWKQNPAAVSVFSTCLCEVKFPNTSVFLDQLLPPSLLFSDDHELKSKVLGVNCLHHIIQNTSASELSWFNRIDVIYSSLERLLYTHEPELLTVLLPCVLDLLKVFDGLEVVKSVVVRPVTKADDVFLRLLSDMHLENNLKPRQIYSKHLPEFMQLLGIGVVRHFKKLFTVIAAFLEISDGKLEQSRLNILEALKCVIEIAWPRIAAKCEDILRMLLPLVYELAQDRGVWADGVKAKLLDKCGEVVVLLKKVDSEQMKTLLEQLVGVKTLPDCDCVIKKWYVV